MNAARAVSACDAAPEAASPTASTLPGASTAPGTAAVAAWPDPPPHAADAPDAASLAEETASQRDVRECLEVDLKLMVDTAFPQCKRRLRQIIYDRGFITAAARFLIAEYGEDVRWYVTAWGSLRLVLQPDLSARPGRALEVAKVGMIIPAPPVHPRILQPMRTWIYGKDRGGRLLGVETYPRGDILGSTNLDPYPEVRAEIEVMKAELAAAGLDTLDVVPNNIGLIDDGARLVLVDNEVQDIFPTRYPRFGGQEAEDAAMDEIDRLVERRHDACLRAQGDAAAGAALAEYQALMDRPDVFITVLEQAIEEDVARTHAIREGAMRQLRRDIESALAAAAPAQASAPALVTDGPPPLPPDSDTAAHDTAATVTATAAAAAAAAGVAVGSGAAAVARLKALRADLVRIRHHNRHSHRVAEWFDTLDQMLPPA